MVDVAEQTVAVIVAHPDDEVLAFGGTIKRHSDRGDKIHVLILATGHTSRLGTGQNDSQSIASLRADAQKASELLGVETLDFAEFPDNQMDTVPLLEVVREVERFLERHKPSTLFTHHLGDLNIDHRVTAQAVLTAGRPLPGVSTRRIITGEVLSSSEYGAQNDRFTPNLYQPLTEGQLEVKKNALSAYTTEIREWPHPRSIGALDAQARLRGAECGHEAAEGFVLVRGIEN